MRKKFIKSSRPTYKKRIRKGQTGMRFVSYNAIDTPTIDYTDITNPINPFSEYNFNTVYDKPEALVVPVKDEAPVEEVINKPESLIITPVTNRPIASKSVTDKPVTANSTWKSPYTNRKQWSTELINAYKKAGITNDNAIRMLLAQDALESSWGKSAQGKYNFGNLTTGSSWKGDYVTGNDKNAKGEAIKQKFRSYNSMDEYAADKIQFLKRLYDFDENDDINKFVAKLTGSNKGKRRYAEAKEYANSLRGVYNSFREGGIIKYQNPSSGIRRLSQEAIADSLNYGWEGQNNFKVRQSRYTNVDPTGNFYSPSDWMSNWWRTLWNSSRDNKGTTHEEALYLRYLGGKRDATQLPQTPIRFSRDYDIVDNEYPNKEYVGLPKEQKDAIRDNVVPNMQSELKEGVWVQVKDDVRRSRDQRGTGNALSGMGKFGLRNNNNSGIFDIVDTYDYPSWIPIPDRNKGYELEIRDTIWTKGAKPELYKVEKGYLPYNANPLQKWAKREVDQLIEQYK